VPGAPLRIAAIGVNHWHSLYDSAYLRHLAGMPDVQLVALQDASAEIAGKCAASLGNPPTFTDYRLMLAETRPDFVIAQGPHRGMAELAHYLLDEGYPFLEEVTSGLPSEPIALTALRDALDHFRRGAVPPISVHDCRRVVHLIDQAYELAGRPYG
jgi:hypothetical protein